MPDGASSGTSIVAKMTKPTVLHIGEPIKYNQEFYESEFIKRFNVVINEDLDRSSFIEALKTKKYV